LILECDEKTSTTRIMRRVRVNRTSYESEKTIKKKIKQYEKEIKLVAENFSDQKVKRVNGNRILKRVSDDVYEHIN